jgi:hypothetical protein
MTKLNVLSFLVEGTVIVILGADDWNRSAKSTSSLVVLKVVADKKGKRRERRKMLVDRGVHGCRWDGIWF